MRVCLQAREDSLAGFLEDVLRGGLEERAHAGKRGELVRAIVNKLEPDLFCSDTGDRDAVFSVIVC